MANWRDRRNVNIGNPANVTTTDSSSFKNKSSLIGKSTAVINNKVLKDVKTAAPLKYLSNFCRSLEIPWLIIKFIFN